MMISSVQEQDFTTPAGWNLNFNVFGNAPSRYNVFNFVKVQNGYAHSKVCSIHKDDTVTLES